MQADPEGFEHCRSRKCKLFVGLPGMILDQELREVEVGGAGKSSKLKDYVGESSVKRVKKVLKGKAPRNSLTRHEREAAAEYYERISGKTVNKFAETASEFNKHRAKYLRGETDEIFEDIYKFMEK